MDPAKVALLAAASGLYELSPKAQELVDSEEFWNELVDTPEDQLTKEQLDVVAEMGLQIDPDASDEDDDDSR